jgi:3-hydroxyisobutyrate dehydrogenase-like beta-hydroxyacid dehydrogenase
VSGGVVRARDGSLLVMASGLDAGSRTLLDPLGDVVQVGPDPGQVRP